MGEIVGIKRKPRPLQRTYSPTSPYVVERHDEEDGEIKYEIWDHRPDSYRRVCVIEEGSPEDPNPERGHAMAEANLVCDALNLQVQCGKEKLPAMPDED